jgi:Ser/Thr protein kinase RdoA (MazF antagonist)
MKAFDRLTRNGRLRRLRRVVLEALQHYDLRIERVALLDRVIERADRLYARLYADADGLILIHGDLHYWNVHVHRGDLHVIDFEDVMLGYPMQDVAVTLSYGRQREGYEEWWAAFREGYARVHREPVQGPRAFHGSLRVEAGSRPRWPSVPTSFSGPTGCW